MAATETALSDLFPEITLSSNNNQSTFVSTFLLADGNASLDHSLTEKISYAQEIQGNNTKSTSWQSDTSNLNPTRKGDYFSILIDDDMYMQ